ncbi:hypothetical protein P43SY_007018 [Pythium insidiosum]|uniref:Lariat debranching enzyme C-terminal domain-containing protein n=1 Tax=Pythium insidiosum TaxID=114742 RepID=A0AAD5M6L3_PYTIN|nr:hypothetical protein P43SY_007018 [Pythium insidiosum]
MRVAVVGCAHGMLDDIFATVQFINEMEPNRTIELLLCCGDFECMRNSRDLETLACPPKYRAMHAFHQYYSGAKVAPVLTVFVGGNHEASNYLHDLHYGGWVAPNMFYLGAAGCINVGGLRIAGLSGIYKHQDYTAGRYEREPFDNSTMRSIYHVREIEVFQLGHLQQQDKRRVSIFLSHDWPRGIEQYGDLQSLLRRKPFFQEEIQANALGSPAGEYLLHVLRPAHWFAAHLHVKFAAIVRHQAAEANSESNEPQRPDAEVHATSEQEQLMTKFLALDKCLPRREFLQVIDIPTSMDASVASSEQGEPTATTDASAARDPPKVMFDFEWLAVLRATHHLVSSERYAPRVPQEDMPIEENDLLWLRSRMEEYMAEKGITDKVVGEWLTDFVKTVPAYGEENEWTAPPVIGNPQTDMLLELLKLPHIVTTPFSGRNVSASVEDPNAIDLDDDEEEQEDEDSGAQQDTPMEAVATDPNEIDLDE